MVCSCTDRCPAPRRCCTSCQRCTSGGSGWMRCSTSCLGSCAARWAPGSGADQHSRQSCTVCLKTWLGETHKAVVTLILLIYLQSHDHMNMMETMWYSLIYWFIVSSPYIVLAPYLEFCVLCEASFCTNYKKHGGSFPGCCTVTNSTSNQHYVLRH